jgi:hypothetical protein
MSAETIIMRRAPTSVATSRAGARWFCLRSDDLERRQGRGAMQSL